MSYTQEQGLDQDIDPTTFDAQEILEIIQDSDAGLVALTPEDRTSLIEQLKIKKPVLNDHLKPHEIMDLITASESGYLLLTDDEHKFMRTLIKNSVDRLTEFHHKIEKEIQLNEEYAKQRAKKAKTLKNQLARLDNYVTTIMIKGQYEKLPGHEFHIKLSKPRGSVVVDREPTEEDYKNHKKYVREEVTRSWIKDAIRKDLERGEYFLGNAEIIKEPKAKFELKKG